MSLVKFIPGYSFWCSYKWDYFKFDRLLLVYRNGTDFNVNTGYNDFIDFND